MTVKELREKYKLTQSALAKSLGVSSNAISAVEAGRLKLSNKLAAKIMETYGEDVAAAPAVKAEKADRPEAKIEKPAAEAAAAPAAKAVEAAPAAPAPVEKKAVKRAKKAAKEKKAAEKKEAAPKKAAAKKAAAKKAVPAVILQSPFGGEITVDAVKTLVGDVDKVYVRIDQNKLYWVKGKETGDTDIW
jgi:DNA-binding XRE family transcriptional regulator